MRRTEDFEASQASGDLTNCINSSMEMGRLDMRDGHPRQSIGLVKCVQLLVSD
jgi:hypothetical protein